MTKNEAYKFMLCFADEIIGKPISKQQPFSNYLITRSEVIELEPGCFQINLISESDEENSEHKTFLINYLNEFDISFDRTEFGFLN